MAARYKALNLAQVQTTTLRKRECLLQVEMLADVPDPEKPLMEFYRGLPRVGRAASLLAAADCLAQAAISDQKSIVWLVDAPLIDAGVSPLLIRLIHRGLVHSVAMTGAAAVRDYELAFYGKTRESLAEGLRDGLLGMSRETGEGMNQIINEGVKRGFSMGECLGRGILDRQPKFYNRSILAACAARLATATVHVSVGCEGFHCHPMADGAMLGKGSLKDLQIFASRLEGLNEGGVLVSVHSNPALQQVFHAAYALARNLGSALSQFSLIKFGEQAPDFSEIPGIAATHDVPGPMELTLPLFTGVLFSLVE